MNLELGVDLLFDRETVLYDIITMVYYSRIVKARLILFNVRRYFVGQHASFIIG
jgi:hypothetical protein